MQEMQARRVKNEKSVSQVRLHAPSRGLDGCGCCARSFVQNNALYGQCSGGGKDKSTMHLKHFHSLREGVS